MDKLVYKKRGEAYWSVLLGDVVIGSVSRNPDSSEVLDPGRWTGSIWSEDGSLIGGPVSDTREEVELWLESKRHLARLKNWGASS